MAEDTSDELTRLLARTALGDRAAFRRVYDLTHRHLLGVAVRLLKRQDLGEEVLQDVYVAVWRRAHGYQAAAARPMTWLMAMVRHRAIDLLRSRAASEIEAQTAAMQEAADLAQMREATAAAARDFDSAIERRRITPCMAELAGTQRQCLALAYYEGLSHAEVATHLAVPIGSVKTWIRRGLDHLRRCLGRLEAA